MTQPVNDQQPTERARPGHLGRLLASTGVSIAGQGMVTAAVPLLAASLTRDPFAVSVVAAATYAAWLVVGLPAGTLVDRWPRRLTMVVADIVRAALLAGLSVGLLAHKLTLPALVVVVFLIGAAGCFFEPAAQASIPNLVGRYKHRLASANSRIWTLDILGRSLIGPPVGAALFAIGTVLPFGANAVTFLVSAVLLSGLRQLGRPASDAEPMPVRHSLVEGVRYLAKHPELRALTVGMGAYNLAYNTAFATLVLFAQDRLHLDDRGFGFLLSMLAVGGLMGGWLAPRVNRWLTARRVYAVGLLLQAVAWLMVVLVARPLVSGVALVILGFASMIVTVVGGTARQSLTPDRLLGRISAGARVIGIGTAAIGALMGGSIARAMSLPSAFYTAAIIAGVAAIGFWAASFRSPSKALADPSTASPSIGEHPPKV